MSDPKYPMIDVIESMESIGDEQPRGTIVFDNDDFSPETDSESLRAALKPMMSTDHKALIEIATKRKNKQRQEIMNEYKQSYGRELLEDLKVKLTGNFEVLMRSLFKKPVTYDAHCLHNAMKSFGTDDMALIDILCARSNCQIRAIRAVYKQRYGTDLSDDLDSDTDGSFQCLLVSLCNADRDESDEVNEELADKEANKLYDNSEGMIGINEEVFNKILCKRTYKQLRLTFAKFRELAGKDIVEVIDAELHGDVKQGFLAIVRVARCLPGYYAIRLRQCMEGMGTSDNALVRIIASRAEKDMVQVKKAFNFLYRETLADCLAEDISGDYKKLCLAML